MVVPPKKMPLEEKILTVDLLLFLQLESKSSEVTIDLIFHKIKWDRSLEKESDNTICIKLEYSDIKGRHSQNFSLKPGSSF